MTKVSSLSGISTPKSITAQVVVLWTQKKQHLLLQKYFRYGVTLEYSVMLEAMPRERFETPTPMATGVQDVSYVASNWVWL